MTTNAYSEYRIGRRSYGRNTQTAGTVIKQLIEPWPGAYTRINAIRVTTSTTAHLMTLMRPLNKVTASAAVAEGGTSLILAAQPGDYNALGVNATADNNIATNDYVCYQLADGTYVAELVTVSSLTLTITAVPTGSGGILAGSDVWFYGIVTDVNPNNAQAHPRFTLTASVTNNFDQDNDFVFTTIKDHRNMNLGNGRSQPVILLIDNGTAASVLEYVSVEYHMGSAVGGP